MKCKKNKFLRVFREKNFNRVLPLKLPIANLLKSQISGLEIFLSVRKCLSIRKVKKLSKL